MYTTDTFQYIPAPTLDQSRGLIGPDIATQKVLERHGHAFDYYKSIRRSLRKQGYSAHTSKEEHKTLLRSKNGKNCIVLEFGDVNGVPTLEVLTSTPIDSDFIENFKSEFPKLTDGPKFRKLNPTH